MMSIDPRGSEYLTPGLACQLQRFKLRLISSHESISRETHFWHFPQHSKQATFTPMKYVSRCRRLVPYEDELIRVVLDVDDTPENEQFFMTYKPVLLERFRQIEIYIVSYPVDVL
jgi:hypothetical protein